MISHCLIIAEKKKKILYRAGKKAHVFQTDQDIAGFTKLLFFCISYALPGIGSGGSAERALATEAERMRRISQAMSALGYNSAFRLHPPEEENTEANKEQLKTN